MATAAAQGSLVRTHACASATLLLRSCCVRVVAPSYRPPRQGHVQGACPSPRLRLAADSTVSQSSQIRACHAWCLTIQAVAWHSHSNSVVVQEQCRRGSRHLEGNAPAVCLGFCVVDFSALEPESVAVKADAV